YWGEMSDDLSKGIFRAFSPLTDDDSVANVHNLYLRDDLRTLGAGTYELLTGCPACEQPGGSPLPQPTESEDVHVESYPAGASKDFAHIAFESDLPLTPESTAFSSYSEPVENVFESEHGTVRLVGLVPPSAEVECGPTPLPTCQAAPESKAGFSSEGSQRFLHIVSEDGSRISFTVPAPRPDRYLEPAGCDGLSLNCGGLYLRIDHAVTVQVNASERTVPDPAGHAFALFGAASVDGRRIFFTTREALTDDAPADGNIKLYLFDL